MVTFATCRLDVAGRSLSRNGQVQHLEPQAFDVLAHLFTHRGRVVPKAELIDAVWGSQFVTEAALTTRIKEIRRATGDDGETQSIIRTFRGLGYRFVAEVGGDTGPNVARSRLWGRERDLDEIEQRLAPGAVVTIVGPGGVGKTTLARALVSRAAPRFAEGALAVDLSVLDDPSQLLAVVARAAGIKDSGDSPVTEVLGRRSAVLLLDDADDLVAEAAELCAALAGQLAIVVTSRERLGLPAERLWPLLPLDAEPARQLLAERARALAPRGSLADARDEELDVLADAVDRLPLALEMLAGMSAMVGAEPLHDLVGTRPDLVTSPVRNAPARHRSLERLVDASVSRLGEPERQALLRLTSFAGPFDARDAAEVIDGDEALVLVGQLVDRSLLASLDEPSGPRLQLLRTVRNVALRHGDREQLDEAARRHAMVVTARLVQADVDLRGEDEGRAARVFDLLADEARAAHTWARTHDIGLAIRLIAALHLYAYSRLWAEPSRWAEAMLVDGRGPEPVVAVLVSQAAQEGRLPESLSLAEPLLASSDVRVRGWALEAVSDVSIYLGELDRAVSAASELMDLGRATSDGRMLAIGVTNRGLALTYGGKGRETLALLDREEAGWTLPRAPSERAWLAFTRGEALNSLGDPEATGPLQAAAALGDSVGNGFVAGVARSSLAEIQRQQGDLVGSAATYAGLLDVFARQGNVTHLTGFLRGCVETLVPLGERETALAVASWALGQRGPSTLGRGSREVGVGARPATDCLTQRPGRRL